MEDLKQQITVLLLIVLTTPFSVQLSLKPTCTDGDGKKIPHGTQFTPNFEEPCQKCICDYGYTTRCSTAACSPPPDCVDRKAVPRECCLFLCANSSHPPSVHSNTTLNDIASAEEDNITNLSLRLVASTVTTFLVLALLLFMVHRLRQRRQMMAMRRFEAQARQQRGEEEEGDHYIPAAFLHIECPPYEDPPPPYSPPKPPHILPAESPPPYEELENDTASDLDANANVSNNNNNNDQSCQQHGQLPLLSLRGDTQPLPSNQNTHLLEAVEALNTSSDGSSLDSCSQGTAGGKSTASSQGREEETELKLMSRRQSHPYDRSTVPFRQDYSLFTTAASRSSRIGACEQAGPEDTGCVELSAGVGGRHRYTDSHGAAGGGKRGGGGRGARKTGRSCSFSFTRSPEEDETLNNIALGPMSHSYHAAAPTTTPSAITTDSSVQTHGSYTASLSRHKGRGLTAERKRSAEDGEGERGGEQRMVTKPLVKCDAAVQHSHRLLQEELRRNLPRAAGSVSDNGRPPPVLPSSFAPQLSIGPASQELSTFSAGKNLDLDRTHNTRGEDGREAHHVEGRGGVSQKGEGGGGAHRDRTSAPPACGHGDVRSDPDAGMPVWCGEAASERRNKVSLPRSQSITSTFSVCSETGEVHVKKASALTDANVLQSDCQYPEQTASKPCPSILHHSAHPANQPGADHPTSLPNYVFPSHASSLQPSIAASPQCGGSSGASAQMLKNKTTTAPTSQTRRPVPSPPSQELRPAAVPSAHRSQSAKPKHKKMHLVPVEKSKTIKSKKEKGKGAKKGDTDPSHRRHDSGSRTNSGGTSQVVLNQSEELSPPARGHQPKLGVGDVIRGRVPASVPSVKQYGFLDLCPPSGVGQEAVSNSGCDGAHLASNLHRTLPPKSHVHSSGASHLPANHRGHVIHGDKPHPTARPKNKTRPLSSGLVVEPGRDLSDPVTSLSHQNSLARRRAKTLHLKKSRQSYPAPDGALGGERKAVCMDLGFVEPSPECARTVCATGDMSTFTVPSKRRAVDRGCNKLPLGSEPPGLLEGRMSSYV